MTWYQQLPSFISIRKIGLAEHIVGCHLVSYVKRNGPLEVQDAYAMENYYGFLVLHCSGTLVYQKQLLFLMGNLCMLRVVAAEMKWKNDTKIGHILQNLGISVEQMVAR